MTGYSGYIALGMMIASAWLLPAKAASAAEDKSKMDNTGSLTIAENGKARAVIVHNGHNGMPVAFQQSREYAKKQLAVPVVDLQSYIAKITGAELPLVATLAEAAESPAIVLELVDKLRGASERPTGAQAYRIHTEGNRLLLTATTELGLSHAVYGLLEDHLGCHFYTVRIGHGRSGAAWYEGPGHEVVPQRPSLALKQIDDFQEPSFPNRGLIYKLGAYPLLVKNRAVGTYSDRTSAALNAGHNLYQLLPPNDIEGWIGRPPTKKTIPGLFKDHPEIYPLNRHGERKPDLHNMSLCGTATTLPSLLAKALIGDLLPDFDGFVNAGQGDGFARCYCEHCRALVDEQHSELAPTIEALNHALDIIGKTHPRLKVITFSYFGTLDAPQTLKPHPNLWINVVSSSVSLNAAGDQMGPVRNNPANREYARALREWPKLAAGRVTVWHWDTYRAEWPSMFYVADNMRFMHEAGVFGVNPQVCGGPWSDLLNWLYVKLAWNINADADALIRQYLADLYSEAAAPHLWNYLKIGTQAYEDALHVPSAVRWSGWTQITMHKIFHEAVRERMIVAMDQAEAAVRKQGSEAQLANFLQERDRSLDTLVLEAAKRLGQNDWGFVRHVRDGRDWYVPGADPRLPMLLERGKHQRGKLPAISKYVQESGGPAVDLVGKSAQARIVPDLSGQIISIVDGASGRELLATGKAEGGYEDTFPLFTPWQQRLWLPMAGEEDRASREGNAATLWSGFFNPTPDQLRTELDLGEDRHLLRTVRVDDADGVKIERVYNGTPLVQLKRFTARWRLALPSPERSRLSVAGGGVRQFIDLRYAKPGGIRFVQAGQRPPGYEGLDAMEEKWDAVVAVSDAATTDLALTKQEGDVVVQLDRGDGVAVVLTTAAAGWKAVQIRPVIGEHYLEVTLVGDDLPAEGMLENHRLPPQTLAAKAVPPGEPLAAAADEPAPTLPKIKITGETTAVNEADGAELIYIPAGLFIRGSETKPAGSDEGPVRDIHLDGYWIYKVPVTVAQYRRFAEATGCEYKPMWGQQIQHRADPKADENVFPMFLNWFDAKAYAEWANGALPTEAQWEKAARGTDGRAYPWGDTWDTNKLSCMENTVNQFMGPFRPVGSIPAGASPYGVLDMAGNGWEWVADWYRHTYYADAPNQNPPGPAFSNLRVVRGGCSLYDERFSRTTARMALPPEVDNWTPIGFRLVIASPGPGMQK